VPALTRWLVRAAMLYLVAALLLGVALESPVAGSAPVLRAVWPTYLHILVVGWLTQFIFGVGYWLFPRYSAERPRGSELLGWAAFALINAGLVVRIVAEPWHAMANRGGGLLVASAVFQLAAGWAFVANTWPRIRER